MAYGVRESDSKLLEQVILENMQSKSRKLNLSRFHLNCWPEFLNLSDELPHIKRLYIDNNRLRDLSETISLFEHLRVLSAVSNMITSIPRVVFSLGELYALNLSSNGITEIPKEIVSILFRFLLFHFPSFFFF